jgi:hypothetical protein
LKYSCLFKDPLFRDTRPREATVEVVLRDLTPVDWKIVEGLGRL